jgi:hypothetical protein
MTLAKVATTLVGIAVQPARTAERLLGPWQMVQVHVAARQDDAHALA